MYVRRALIMRLRCLRLHLIHLERRRNSREEQLSCLDAATPSLDVLLVEGQAP